MDQKWWWPKSHTSKCKSSTMVNLKLAKLQNWNLMFTKIKYDIKRKYFVILEKLTRISANFKLIYKADVMLLTSLNEIEGLSYILRLRISKQRFWNLFHKMIDTCLRRLYSCTNILFETWMFQITFYFNDRGININVQTSKLDLCSVGTLINLNFHLT